MSRQDRAAVLHTRLAFHLLRTDRRDVDSLAAALTSLRDQMKTCAVCCTLAASDPCDLCSDAQRSGNIICVVEESADLVAIERSGSFRGRYHVLQGTLSPLDGVGPEDLRVAELMRRLADGTVREVLIATNPTGGRGGAGTVSGPPNQTARCPCDPDCARAADGRRGGVRRHRHARESRGRPARDVSGALGGR